jgi:hypothetical protein
MLGATRQPANKSWFLFCFLLLAAALLRADDFWKSKPRSEWSAQQALKLLENSPWARQEIQSIAQRDTTPDLTVDSSRAHCDPDALDPNGNCMQRRITIAKDSSRSSQVVISSGNSQIFLVRWESAEPVAEAFRRLEELGERATVAFLSAPPRLPQDRYVITVKLLKPASAARDAKPAVSPADTFGPLQDLKGNSRARLKVGDVTVLPVETERSGVGAAEAVHFFFPREAGGAPLFHPGREVRAEFEFHGERITLKTRFSLDPRTLH